MGSDGRRTYCRIAVASGSPPPARNLHQARVPAEVSTLPGFASVKSSCSFAKQHRHPVKTRGLQLHRIAEVRAKNARTMLQQQWIQRSLYDRVAGREARAIGLVHRTLLLRQGIEQVGEGR